MNQFALELLIKSTALFVILIGLSVPCVRASADGKGKLFIVLMIAAAILPLSLALGPEIVVWQTVPDVDVAAVQPTQKDVETGRPYVAADAVLSSPSAVPSTQSYATSAWVVYFLISVVVMFFLFLRTLRTNRAIRHLEDVHDDMLQREFEAVRNEFCAATSIQLCWQDDSPSTFTWGVFTPVIGLPTDFGKWSIEKRNAAFVHEIAHVERNDCAAILFARFIASVYWWHPLAWIALSRFKQNVERAADDRVLASGIQAVAYAQYLTEIARRNSAVIGLSVAMAASRRTLRDRISALISSEQRRNTMSKTTQLSSMAIGLALTVLIGSFQVTAAPAAADRGHIRLYSPPPVYPKSLLDEGIEGYVDLQFDIDPSGSTSNITVVRQIPASGGFEQAAIAALRTFRYLPKIADGEAVVEHGVKTRLQFKLAADDIELHGESQREEPSELIVFARSISHSNRDLRARLIDAAKEADENDSGDRFLALADVSYQEQPELASYFLLRATQLGTSAPDKLTLLKAMTLYELGDLERSRELFMKIAEQDGESPTTASWIVRLDYQIKRRRLVYDELMSLRD